MRKNLTELVFILDRSGSICSVRCSRPLEPAWKERIDDDYKKRGG